MQYRFGDFELTSQTQRLTRAGSDVSLRGHAFQVLELLVRRAPEVVSQEDIQREVWGHDALSESSIPQAIRDVRAALEDDARKPVFVATRYGRGYQLIAPVVPADARTARTPGKRGGLTLVAAAAAIAFAGWLWLPDPVGDPSPPQRIFLESTAASSEDSLSEPLARYLEFVLGNAVGADRIAVRRPGEEVDASRLVALDLSVAESTGGRAFRLLVDADEAARVSQAEVTTLIETGIDRVLERMEISGDLELEAGLVSKSSYAVETLLRGMAAQLSGDRGRAIELFEACLEEDPDFDFARYELAIALRVQGEYERALGLLEALALRHRTPFWRWRLNNAAGVTYWRQGRHEDAIASYELARAAAQTPYEAALVGVNLGLLLRDEGRTDEAEQVLIESNAIAAAAGSERLLASGLNTLASIYMRQGRYDEALAALARARELFYEVGNRQSYASVLSRTSRIHELRGDRSEAAALLRLVLEVRQQLDDTLGVAATQFRLAAMARTDGDFATSRSLARTALDSAIAVGDGSLVIRGHRELAYTALAGGRVNEAMTYATEAARLADLRGRPAGVLATRGLLATIELERDPLADAAAGIVDEVTRLAEASGDVNALREAQLLRAELAIERGETTDARVLLDEALTTALASGDGQDATRALSRLARLTLAAKPSQALEFLERAEPFNPPPYPFLVLRADALAQAGRETDALVAAIEARNRVGDWWSDEDQALLDRLERAQSAPREF